MRLKAVFAAVLGAALLLTASGCSITDLSKEDMLRPPKTMGDEAEIEQLIASTAKGGYTLKYPKSGSNRSAVVLHDLDGDNVDEAIAFFRDKEGSTGVHMLVMYERDGEWKASNDFITETTDVDCVDFADIDTGDTQEILVGYSTYSAGVNFLSVYTYHDGVTETIDSGQNYSSFYCGNLDSSGKSKVITLSLFNAENEANATMLEYDSQRNSLFAQASAAMDGNVASYRNVVFSTLESGINCLVVDGVLTNGEMVTQVIYYNRSENVLRNPLYRERTANPTQRAGEVLSTDINNDMQYEIPTVTSLPFNTKSEGVAAAQQVVWNSFNTDTEELQPVQRTVADYVYAYTVKIPDTWQDGSFTALLDEGGGLLSFCEWNGDGPGMKLFDIKVFKLTDWEQGKDTDGYTLISKDSRYAYAFVNHKPASIMAMDDNEIKTAFAMIGKSSSVNRSNQQS